MILENRKEKCKMSIHKFRIQFPDGAMIERCEWGKTRNAAFKTICGIYGVPGVDFKVVA